MTRDFVTQYYNRKWKGIYGYAPTGYKDEFGIASLAEWTWNVKGRSEKEFAIAYATRHKYKYPELFGEWIELTGPIYWDTYKSYYQINGVLRKMPFLIKNRPERPVEPSKYPDGLYLGGGILEWFTTKESFDEKIETLKQALALAEKMEQADIITATKYVLVHVKTLKSIYQILESLYASDISEQKNKDSLKKALADLQENLSGPEITEEQKKLIGDIAVEISSIIGVKTENCR